MGSFITHQEERAWGPQDPFITHQDLETMETSGLFHYSPGFRDNGDPGPFITHQDLETMETPALSLLTRI